MKYSFLLVALLAMSLSSKTQTLFTYGTHKASAADFLKAYNKSNSTPAADRAKSIKDYLDLYIKSRLKIQEAYDRHYDTLPQIKQEVENLRIQISENYMTEPEFSDRLVKEAFSRKQKDIHVAHIFISFKNANNIVDTIAALHKRDEVLQALQKGTDFAKVAEQYSDDPSVKNNKGDIGYITVFTLPYEFETTIYNTPVGKYSATIRSKEGYHIFKNIDERNALGKMKAQQILFAFPPGADDVAKKKIKQTADSVYKRIIAGESFSRMATTFSNDYISAAAGGEMPDISVGQYDPIFEKQVWALTKDGAVSKPFLTNYGWHIVKRVSIKPIITDINHKVNYDVLKQHVMADSRWKASNDFIFKQLQAKSAYKKYPYDDAALWNMSDSVLDQKPMNSGWAIKATTPLFSIGDSVYNANAWVSYANTFRYKQDGTGAKPWEQVRDEWVKHEMKEYYRQHLEDFNEDFRYQMQEFKDGNLFFEIMQNEVWNKAQNDSTELKNLYEKNKSKYLWHQSADAVVFYCPDEITAKDLYSKIKINPSDWRKISEAYSDKIVIDSSRYEWERLPKPNTNIVAQKGLVMAPVINGFDNTASFAYIINYYPNAMQRSYSDAKEMLLNDYQAILENKWNEALLKKYPVKIDEQVLAEIVK
ncbi:MAG: peptidylprolyl isomerase [Bacteroidetes bacterium]|nr:peptidylprolyl isomerase [Bacteroidota bacterium]